MLIGIYDQPMYDVYGMQKAAGAPSPAALNSLKRAVSRKIAELNATNASRASRIYRIGEKLNTQNYADGLTDLANQATSILPRLSLDTIEKGMVGTLGTVAALLLGARAINDKTQGAAPKDPPHTVEETKKVGASRARRIAALKDRQSQEKQQKEFNAANDAYNRALFGAGGVLTGGALGAAIAGEGNRLTGGLIGGGVGGGAGLLAHYLAKKHNLV